MVQAQGTLCDVMPTPEQILINLSTIANNWQVLSIIWHVYFSGFALSLLWGWRPSKRFAGIFLVFPLLSVSIVSWVYANLFNGMLFGLVGLALLIISSKLPKENVRIAPMWAVIVGAFMFIFGWIYPHFLETTSLIQYLYATPVGLIPCPTLSMVVGLTTVFETFSSRAWTIVLGATALFYGFFGAIRLGVTIDFILLFGALMLFFMYFFRQTRSTAK